MLKLFLISSASLILCSCASTLSDLNRRPFVNNMSLMVFNHKAMAQAKPVGKKTFEKCNSRFPLVFFTLGSEPTFSELSNEIKTVENVKYMTNVKSLEYASSGFLMGKTCIALEGETYL